MRNETREKYTAYLGHIAKLNGVASAVEKFTVNPTIQQKLETRMQESSSFLQAINIIGVTEQQGSKVGLGIGSPVASTTNTSTTDRAPKDPTAFDEYLYNCTQTNFDTFITYAKLDAWAKFPDFQARIRDVILIRQALDRMTIGFNGTSRAPTSDIGAHPLMQDVNIGWLQKIRADQPARWMKEVVAASGVINVGTGGDYANLDALIFDAVANLIAPWHQEDTGLVAVCGRDLLHDKYFPLVNQENRPVDMQALDMIISQKRIGGLPAVRVPYFPAGKVLITNLQNLSIYFQDGARRRTVLDNAKRDRIENYESSNDAYVIEDYSGAALIENITAV